MQIKEKKIFKKSIALELMQKHNYLYSVPNKSRIGFVVFIFEETESLLNDLTDITNRDK